MLLLKENTIKKAQVNKLLKLISKLDIKEDKKYKVEANKDNIIYTEATRS